MYTHRHFGERVLPAPVNAAPSAVARKPARRWGAGSFTRALPIEAGTLLLAIIVSGLLVRVFIAGIEMPRSGYAIDIGDFTIWGQRMAASGPGAFYAGGGLADYPPGYMYVLWALGAIGKVLEPVVGINITAGLVKIPPILADAGVAWLLFTMGRRFLGEHLGDLKAEQVGLAAAAIYIFNPGVIFDSTVWGQVDSVGTLAVLATIYFLARGWTEAAAAGAVIALLIKFQFAFIIPVVLVVGLKRHLFGRSADPSQADRPDLLRILTSLAAGLGTTVLLIAPFGLSIWSPGDATTCSCLWGRFVSAASTYSGLSINAFNLWMNPFSGLAGGPDTQVAPSLQWGSDQTVVAIIGSFGVTWQLVGIALFVAVGAAALWVVVRRDDAVGLLVASLLLAVAFFALPTRVHERYLFPALAIGALLVMRDRRWAVAYGLISLCFFTNVYGIYTADWSFYQGTVLNPGVGGVAMVRDPVLNATLLSPMGIYLLSALIVGLLGWLVVEAVRLASAGAREADAGLIRTPAAALPASASIGSAQPSPWGVLAEADSAADPATAAFPTEAPLPVARPAPEMVASAPGLPPSGWHTWLRQAPDDPLYREPRRPLDRLDLALVIGFVVFAFLFRLWRLDVPRTNSNFDEVYHARSATEWLADWEHGWTRDVYEWTHPMLAKYLIAAGIEIADPNKVVGSTPLDAPSSALTVAPRRTSLGFTQSISFSAAESQIVARDALSGDVVAHWAADGPVAALAYQESNQRLLVGVTSGGSVAAYDLNAFLGAHGARASPPKVATIKTGIASVVQILAPADGAIVAMRGSDGLAVAEGTTGVILAPSTLVAGGIAYAASTGGEGNDKSAILATLPGSGEIVSLDATTLKQRQQVTLQAAPIGPIAVIGEAQDQQAWVPVGALTQSIEHGPTDGGMAVLDAPALSEIATVPLPGRPSALAWQPVADIVYVSGTATGGSPQVWTVNPLGDNRSGFATFDATSLPAAATAMVIDASDHAQGDDDARLLVATSGQGASLVQIDAGSNAFAWRFMGIIFGAALVGLIYLLAATMFRRRGVAILAASFVALDAMSYVMSRIAMNDIYVAAFIVAAYLLFWQVWSGRWARSAWWVLPLVGIVIGLAAATKWVGLYAIVGLWVLVLGRSALGRFLLVAGLAFLAIVAGIGAPWPFAAVMVVGMAVALLLVYARPIRLAPGDLMALPAIGVVFGGVGLAFAIAYNQVAGRTPQNIVELGFGFLARGTQAGWPAWIMLGVAALLIAWRAVASLRDAASDRRWFQPGELAGFGWPWVAACLLVLPLLVYFVVYIPYLQLGHTVALPDHGPGYGWSLDEMQAQMFGYHFGLTAGHPASSPWWSWPLDLKTVWFFGSSYDDRQIAAIYNGGNPILFWAGVPAIVACGFLAWRRRSAALALLVVAFGFQFLPWTRIERATFEYHYLTAVIFSMVAVAYVIDEALRNRLYQSLGIAFLAAAAVVGVLIWPLGSAWPMPDFYMNAARSLPPWNYAFQFPSPPPGVRGPLVSTDTVKLAAGVAVSLMAGAFALFGRGLVASLRPAAAGSGSWPQGADQEQDSQEDDGNRPDAVRVEQREVVAGEEPRPDEDQERAEDERSTT
jgi:predicted membrane-bound dolichyl-phosphate-mannose-protein mannosyltransferase/Gpi18-like mannosyltransferase